MSIVLSSKQMQALDQKTIVDFGLPALLLMENAGKGCADFLQARFPEAIQGHIVILHGSGNNSGDGFVIARWLHEAGHKVSLLQLHEGVFSPESLVNYQLCKNLSIPDWKWQDDPELAAHLLDGTSLIIDTVFGIGFRGELPAEVAAAFIICNRSKAIRIAIDIPSGINADTGIAAKNALCAHHTLAIHALKTGHILHAGKRNSGFVHIIPIGIPAMYHHELNCQELVTRDNCIYPHRDPQAHKGSFGRVFIIGGSPGFSGSVALASQAALRSGAGYVYLVSRNELELHYASLTPEIMFRSLPHITNIPEFDLETYADFLKPTSAILIGPGLGLDEYALSVLDLVGNHFIGKGQRLRIVFLIDFGKEMTSLGLVQLQSLTLIESTAQIHIRGNSDRTQQRGYRKLAALIDMHKHHIVDIDIKFEPGTIIGNHFG